MRNALIKKKLKIAEIFMDIVKAVDNRIQIKTLQNP